MQKTTIIFLLFSLIFTPLSIKTKAQTPRTSVCGLTPQDARTIYNDMIELRQRHPIVASNRAVAYVPVWFHLVAKNDGTGRVSMIKVLEMLCEWNRLYSANGVELQFYIKGINNINSTTLYDGARTFAGENLTRSSKKNDGINVFIVNSADDPSQPNSTILGYYLNSGTGVPYEADWLVMIKQQVSTLGAVTIAHEIGHFFSLPHTFFGWESCPFQPTSTAPCAPATVSCFDGSTYTVENAARTGAIANCATAADGFCDTPPDYNLGYGYAGCSYIGLACDPKGIKIDPDEKNIMGYFVGCESTFSPLQKTAMKNNYINQAQRAYIRAGNLTPSASAFTLAAPTLLAPIGGVQTKNFNNFTLSWQSVLNATAYVVEISKSATFFDSRTFIATSNALNINASMALGYFTLSNITYYWRVKPYNNFAACGTISAAQTFKSGTLNPTNEMGGISSFDVSPTPLSKNAVLSLNLTTETTFDAQIKLYNVSGKLMKTEKRTFEAGFSSQTMSVSDLNSGLYILTIESEKGVLNKKIVIQ